MRTSHGTKYPFPSYRLINIFRFLLVSLSIEEILQESTIYRRRERLSKITRDIGLGDAYGTTIERIKAQGGENSRLGIEALMWISHAERLLSADELRCALCVRLGSTDFNAGDVPSMRALVSCCQGLITVDKDASTVRLIHFTLQEYLLATLDIFSRPHSGMAEICLTYLNSEQVNAIPANCYPGPLDNSFLKYCSLYWGVHAKRELSDYARSLALGLLQEYDGHISTEFLLKQVTDPDLRSFDPNFRFSGLHCASFFGIVELVDALIEMGCYDINERDLGGYTPLSYASQYGHEGVVRILLEREDLNPDQPDNGDRTPLSYAAQYGYGGVVELLLVREDLNPDKPDNRGQTPLLYAAWSGHERAWDKHEGVVKMLLVRDEVNPDKPDNGGRTPLSHAAQYGCEGVVEILLRREEVDPNKLDNRGQTPLSYAACGGHEGVVEILLRGEKANPDKPDNGGRTPLSHAAQYGHEGVVKILLEREEVNPNKPDNNDQTPLMFAAKHGHEGVIALLRPYEDVTHSAI